MHPFRLQLSQQGPLSYLQVQKTTSLPFASSIRPLQEMQCLHTLYISGEEEEAEDAGCFH